VTVLIGAPASGKTTLRRRLLTEAPALAVLSLDDERIALREHDVLAGRVPRPLQDYSHRAVQRCAAAGQALLDAGRGYVADATNLRRRERVAHVRAAHAAGLPAVAVLLPALPLAVLEARNAGRPEEQRVPAAVLAKHAHRRSLLDADLLREEGFDAVVEAGHEAVGVRPAVTVPSGAAGPPPAAAAPSATATGR
jgi:predicted kinase